jgi:hypothetical protein
MNNPMNDGSGYKGPMSAGTGGSQSLTPASDAGDQLVDTAKHDPDNLGTKVKEQVGNFQ